MRMSSREAMLGGNNPDVVKNTIYFSRKKNRKKVFILVEGTGDVGFYKNIIDKTNVQVIPMGYEKKKGISAKDNVVSAIEMLNRERTQGVVAIVDTDYDEIVGIKRELDNLIYTDDHDMETMILKTDAYEKFENEFGNEEKVSTYESEFGSVLDNILECGSMIGKTRLLSIRENLKLDFKAVDLENYFNDSLEFDWQNYFKQVLYVSQKITQKEELRQIVQNDNRDYDIWQLCRGHDLTELMVVFFSDISKYKLGNSKAKFLKSESVEQFLRAAYYVPVYFKKTKMFQKLLEWQSVNKDWNLLKSELVQVAA